MQVFLCILLSVVCSVFAFHDNLTQLFKRNAVKESNAIVKLSHLSKRGDTSDLEIHIIVEVNNKVHQYQLRKKRSPLSPNFKIYDTAINDNGEMSVFPAQNIDPLPNIYTNQKRDAALFVKNIGSNIEIEGILQRNLRIVPLRNRDKREFSPHNHKVYEFNITNSEIFESTPPPDYDKRNSKDDVEVIYPEIFIVYDYNSTQLFEGNLTKIRNYLSLYLSMVNRWFEPLTKINISLTCVGILPVKSLDFQSECIPETSAKVFEIGTGIYSFGKCIYSKKKNYINFDIAVFMTSMDLQLNGASDSITGFAPIASACYSNKNKEIDYSVAIIRDIPNGFIALNSFAHEVSHVMGCTHDGEDNSVSGQPSAKACSSKQGYLMAPSNSVNYPANEYFFSKCSEDQLYWYASTSNNAACLKNKPKSSELEQVKTLAGSKVSLETQCKAIFGSKYRYYTDKTKTCQLLKCVYGFKILSSGPPLEGSPCDTDKVCIRGECKKI